MADFAAYTITFLLIALIMYLGDRKVASNTSLSITPNETEESRDVN